MDERLSTTPRIGDGAFILDVARVASSFAFQQKDVRFFASNRHMFYPMRNDDELTLVQHPVTVVEFDGECAFHDGKEFIFLVVVMSDKFAL